MSGRTRPRRSRYWPPRPWELFLEPLRLALLCRGTNARIQSAGFGQVISELIDEDSATSRFAPRFVVVLLVPSEVPLWPDADADVERANDLAQEVCESFWAPMAKFHARFGSEFIVTNFPPRRERPYGNLGAKLPADPNNFLRRINLALGDTAPDYVHLVDLAGLVGRGGINEWLDPRLWFEAKQAVSPTRVPELAHNVAAVATGALGRSRKCLVVDLDNTLWGGVVGDDGVEHIVLGEGSGRGEAFKALQIYLRELRSRGIVLGVCSKNDEATALQPFLHHPEMVLRREDFAVFKANWRPKSVNLREIAAELSLGLDSLVFLDDNPAERAEVAQALTEVRVPEVGDEPSEYPAAIDHALCFEDVRLTEDDRRRADRYRTRAAAVRPRSSTTDLTEFLRSLEMRASIDEFRDVDLSRITQLINKTNQFNLMTQRTTRSAVEKMAADPRCLTRTVRLSDRFGDHGLIAVLTGRIAGTELRLENWLMSCRVLGRGVERALMNEVVEWSAARGMTELRGRFVASGTQRSGPRPLRPIGFFVGGANRSREPLVAGRRALRPSRP